MPYNCSPLALLRLGPKNSSPLYIKVSLLAETCWHGSQEDRKDVYNTKTNLIFYRHIRIENLSTLEMILTTKIRGSQEKIGKKVKSLDLLVHSH